MSYSGTLGLVNVFLNYLSPNRIVCIDLRENWQDWFGWFNDKHILDVHWFESDQNRYDILDKFVVDQQLPIQVVVNTVSEVAGDVVYYRTSLSQEDGLVPPEKLQKIWKNIFTKRVEQHQATAISELIDCNIDKQWLMIDSLNAVTLLMGSAIDFKVIDLIVVRMIFYSGNHNYEAFIQFLEKQGFTLLDQCSTNDVQLVRAVFIRNYTQLFQSISSQYNKLKMDYSDLVDHSDVLEVDNRELLQYKEKLASSIKENENTKLLNAKILRKLKKKKRALKDIEQKYQYLLTSYEDLNNVSDKISQLSDKLILLEAKSNESLKINTEIIQSQSTAFESHKELLDGLHAFNQNHSITQQLFTKGITNVVAQIESYIALNNYFNTGEKLSNYHGWPISPDIALFIVDQMNQKTYDAVIEFGSGTSTELFAKIAERKNRSNQKVPRILSFDHLNEYYQKTLSILSQGGLESYVELKLAPLIPIELDGDSYQYYNCSSDLETFFMSLPENSRILVLVDGPPGTTCKHARYPALPIIHRSLSNLNEMGIDMVLDDSLRPEEHEVSLKWKNYLLSHHVLFNEQMFNNSVKGFCFLGNIQFK